nr:Chain C, beta-PIX [Homo sapiens]5VWI_D Chain D, beta-PIX [Homo sapiens]5VWK_E Chain E, Beta-PIX [Homo sapiens]5VWK_F Chain F, Beta-PIX [Homo sapiens]5VWK_G Chain G, Beta-PIX [Homo sapiens]5VWK_H Chain H, Beta-PIX [Homo sapiens]
PAWDETNL